MTNENEITNSDPDSPSTLIDETIAALRDWRGERLAELRRLIREAEPEVVEEVKWRKASNSMRGVPVWSCNGIICTGETYKDKVKVNFAQGASQPDPTGLFNSSLDGGARRAIDVFESDTVAAETFKALIEAAAEHNTASKAGKRTGGSR